MSVYKQSLNQTKKWYDFGEQKYAGKWRKISIIGLLIGLIVLMYGMLGIFIPMNFEFYDFIYITATIVLFLSLTLLMFVFNKRFYNNILYLLGIIFIGLVIKSMHLPGAAFMLSLGFGISAIGFFFMAIVCLIKFKNNRFLRSYGFIISLIFILTFVGWLFKIMHWPGAGIMILSGTLFYFVGIIGLVFTLPNSGYLEWTKLQRKFFYRSIIIPMLTVFISFTTTVIIPNGWNRLTSDYDKEIFWGMKQIEFYEKEGLE